MMKARTILAGAAAALAMAVSSAFAAPLGPSSTGPGVAQNDLVVQAQAMCRYPGGWAPCRPAYRPGPPPQPRYYAPPPPPRYDYRRERRNDHCAVVYNQCIASYPRHSPPYVSCMRARGC